MSDFDDSMAEPCPGCGRDIDCMLSTCPFCKYDLTGTTPPPKKPKESPPKKDRKPKEEAATSDSDEGGVATAVAPVRTTPRICQSALMVPALGRHGRPALDFPALHWKKGVEATDENLVAWVESLREAWPLPEPRGTGDTRHWLSNHAVGCLASSAKGEHDAVLRENWKRIVDLIGGDDW